MLTLRHKAIAHLALLAAPSVLYAAPVTDVTSFLRLVQDTLNSVVPLLVGVAVVVFLFGVVKYIQAGDQAEKRNEGGQFMLYGIVALFAMVSIWGLVNVLSSTFSLNNNALPIPQF